LGHARTRLLARFAGLEALTRLPAGRGAFVPPYAFSAPEFSCSDSTCAELQLARRQCVNLPPTRCARIRVGIAVRSPEPAFGSVDQCTSVSAFVPSYAFSAPEFSCSDSTCAELQPPSALLSQCRLFRQLGRTIALACPTARTENNLHHLLTSTSTCPANAGLGHEGSRALRSWTLSTTGRS